LPPFFAKKNKADVPVRLLILQAVLVTCFCLLITLMPSINSFYWFLTALSTELYMFMYILLFAAALKLGRPKEALSYQIPKGLRLMTCLLGLFGCALTIFVGYLLPDGIDVGSPLRYASMVALGNMILVAPAFLLCLYRNWSRSS